MKLLHLAYADGGGGAFKAAHRIHRGLRAVGVDSTMLVSKRVTNDPDVADAGSPAGRIWAQLATYLDVLPLRLARAPREDFSSLAWVGTGAARKARKRAPDLVQLHWICAGFMRIEELAALRVPLVWRLADMWAFAGAGHYVGDDTRYIDGYTAQRRPARERGPDLDRWVWERKRRALARVKDLTIVTPSRWLARCASQSVLLRERRVEVIPTGQDTSVYRPIPRRIAREILGLPQEAQLVMAASMGIGEKRKGVALLLQALECIRDRQYHLLLLGDRPPTAPRLPVEAHWLGRLSDDISLALAYSAANVFVAPSTEENLANTVIEAMACGIPCVAFDVGGMPDIIRPPCNGYLATPFSTDELAQGIVAILESGEAYERISDAARSTVVREFSEELQARRFASLYEDVLRSASGRTAPVATGQEMTHGPSGRAS
jgi:glycosyltransferase involved in cell wall biosynthesis